LREVVSKGVHVSHLVRLETAHREVYESAVEPVPFIQGMWMSPSERAASRTLRFIDSYGDTVFNGLQMDAFIEEWTRLSDRALDAGPESARFYEAVLAMAERCRSEVHLYLRFIGD
jgi:hypothetical protein